MPCTTATPMAGNQNTPKRSNLFYYIVQIPANVEPFLRSTIEHFCNTSQLEIIMVE